MLELETASDLLSDNHQACALMAKLSKRTRQIVSDVRRSVHALAVRNLGLLVAPAATVTGRRCKIAEKPAS
jgi:hypothetical protein